MRIHLILLGLTLIGVVYRLIMVEKQISYLEGRASVYAEWTALPSDGTCYARKGRC